MHFCITLSIFVALHIYILHFVGKYFPANEIALALRALSTEQRLCLGTSSRSIFYVTGKQFPVTKKQMTDTVSSVTRFVFIHCVVKTLALAMGI